MTNVKIYSYQKLEPIDILNCIHWARENYNFYDGEVSPLWNEHIKTEFARLKEQNKAYFTDLEITWNTIGADMEFQAQIENGEIVIDDIDILEMHDLY